MLFPEGVVYEPGRPGVIRTHATCLAFSGLRDSGTAELAMVALRRAGTNPILEWLRAMETLRWALAAAA